MTGQRMSPHWWPEGWRLLAASVPHILRGRRRTVLIWVIVGSAVIVSGIGLGAWGLTGGASDDDLTPIAVSGVLCAVIGGVICLRVYQFKDRPRSHIDGYVPESQEASLREALRTGDLIGLPIDVRRYTIALATRNRSAIPPVILPDLVFTGLCLLIVPVAFFTVEGVVPVAVFGFVALLRCGMALSLLHALGNTTWVLDAEARAVAREQEQSAR